MGLQRQCSAAKIAVSLLNRIDWMRFWKVLSLNTFQRMDGGCLPRLAQSVNYRALASDVAEPSSFWTNVGQKQEGTLKGH